MQGIAGYSRAQLQQGIAGHSRLQDTVRAQQDTAGYSRVQDTVFRAQQQSTAGHRGWQGAGHTAGYSRVAFKIAKSGVARSLAEVAVWFPVEHVRYDSGIPSV